MTWFYCLLQMTIDNVKRVTSSQYYPLQSLLHSKSPVMHFLTACCRMCWKMAIQQPQMKLYTEGHGRPMDPEKQEQYFDSQKTSYPVVEFYVKPALIHDRRCLVKGIVYLKGSRPIYPK